MGFVYFIPNQSNIFPASHGRKHFLAYRCTLRAERPDFQPYSLSGETVGDAARCAKLQKEHTFGHYSIK